MTSVEVGSRSAQWLMVLAPLVGISLTMLFGAFVAREDRTRNPRLVARHRRVRLRAVGGIPPGAGSERTNDDPGRVGRQRHQQTSANINTMAAATEEMSMNVASISSASEQISVNVGTISSSAEATAQASRRSRGPSRNPRGPSRRSPGTPRKVRRSPTGPRIWPMGPENTMQELEHSAGEISKVTEAIKMLALQTNLLALNATIEATSAGEAGKGFAVVAREIKELANQSANAAEDIARKIEGVQSSTRRRGERHPGSRPIIRAVHTACLRTSAAVEKQSDSRSGVRTTYAERAKAWNISPGPSPRSPRAPPTCPATPAKPRRPPMTYPAMPSEAAKAVGDISSNIHGISQATRENTTSAQQVNAAAERLTSIARQLQQLVG